jgi:hypothetical protein
MTRRFSVRSICAVFFLAAAVPAAGQARTQAPAAPAAAPAPQASPAPPAQPAGKKTGQLVNIKIEFAITDERSGAPPAKRTVSLIVADAEGGSVRSEPTIFPGSPGPNQLNVDARPELLPGNKIRLGFSLQYDVTTPAEGSVNREVSRSATGIKTNLRESLSLILEDGRPLVVAQSADPNTDRTVTVEVKATVLK